MFTKTKTKKIRYIFMRLVFHIYTAFPVYGANASDKNKKNNHCTGCIAPSLNLRRTLQSK